MGRRTLTGALVLAVVAAAFLWDRARGGPAWACAALVGALVVGATWELLTIGRAPRASGMVLCGAWLALAAWWGAGDGGAHGLLAMSLAAVLAFAALAVGLRAGPGPRTAALVANAGVDVALAGGLALLVPLLLRGELEVVFWLVIVAKTSDIAAYYTGGSLGRRPLVPRISPKKTIEGALGAIVGPALLAATPWLPFAEGLGTLGAAALGAGLGVLAVVSDLVESLVKRSVGVKDSGALLGEAGGVLDLVDSLLLVAPLAWIALRPGAASAV